MNEDVINESKIRSYLKDLSDVFGFEIFDDIDSTNTYLKEHPADEWHTVISSAQSAGRGRMGRTFSSPAGTGLYLSVMLRPKVTAEVATNITTAAAVAACLAIEECTGEQPMIKWVNDIFIRGRKVCGILTEASLDTKSRMPEWLIMGIGFNVYEPENGFPEEIKDIAGAIVNAPLKDLRSRLCASFLKHFYRLCSDPAASDHVSEYKKRSFLIGKSINVISGKKVTPATVLDIDDKCRLVVSYEDGSIEALSSGEVSVRERNC